MSLLSKNSKRPINVKTIKGDLALRKNCVKVDEGWIHSTDSDLIYIDGVPYYKLSRNIKYDNFTKQYVNLNTTPLRLNQGVIGVNRDSKNVVSFEYGYFSDDYFNNVLLFDHVSKVSVRCMNIDLLPPEIFEFSQRYGIFCIKNEIRNLENYVNLIDHRRKGYSIEDNGTEFIRKMDMYKKYKPSLNKNILSYAMLLGKNLTYGVEVETISGLLPDYIQYRTGTVICRDGSLTIEGTDAIGAEYVTVPMNGIKGLYNIQYLLTELSKKCSIDLKCSMHIHFGGFSTDRGFLVSLYNLCHNIQDDLFKMFPYYKTEPSGIKHKNYNQKLLNIFKSKYIDYTSYVNSCYNRLFYFLSGGIFPNDKFNRKDKHHPSGSKWNIESRYYWVNFVNSIFSKRNTIEFRLHTPTMNYMKTIIWLFICNAIIKFAENNQEKLITGSKFTLKDVLSVYESKGETGRFVSEYLWEYYKYKCDIFKKDFDKKDLISMHDIKDDHKFNFSYKGISYWF